MRKVTSFLLLLLIAGAMSVNGQLNFYKFSQSVGSFTPITGGTVHLTDAWDDTMVPSIALGFTFNYLGIDYTQVTISPNGYIVFGGTVSIGYDPISSTTAAAGAASAVGRDLQGRTGSTIRSETIGTAGDFIYVVQWLDAKRYGTSYPDDYFDFQIRLHQNGNKIEFVYGEFVGSTFATPVHPQVGLRGATNADYKNRTTMTNWLQTIPGETNVLRCAITSTVIPPNGLSFLFTPGTCPAPTALAATDITTTAATFGWTPGGSETSWNLEYGLAGFLPGTGTQVSGLAANSYAVSGLQPATKYHFYVQSNCGNGLSDFAGPRAFFTACVPFNIPLVQNFDGVTAPDLPVCWSKIAYHPTSTAGYVQTMTTTTPYSLPNHVAIYNTTVLSADARYLLISPEIVGTVALNTLRAKFYAKSGTSVTTVLVGTMSDPLNAETFTQVASIPLTATYTQYTVSFAAYGGTDRYIAFKHINDVATRYIYLDNVEIEPLPACVEPNMLTATSITANSALLGWTPGGTETMWNVQWGPAGFPIGSGTVVPNLNTNSYNLTGLAANTPYSFYVQSNCGSGNLSPWAGPFTFTTACATFTLPYSQDFTGMAVGTIPQCWNVSGLGLTNWSVQNTANAGGVLPELRFYFSPSFTGLSLMKSPVFNTVGYTAIALQFKHFLDWYAVPFTMGVKTTSDGVNWNTVWEVSPAANIGPETLIIPIANGDVGSSTFQFAFFFDGYSFNLDYWYIDDVTLFAPTFGSLSGYVTEATRGVVEGARVFSGDYEGFTDANGFYQIDNILSGTYDFTCEAEGYFPVTEPGVQITSNVNTSLDFELGYAQISVNPTSFDETMLPNEVRMTTLTISNPGGTEPLAWSAGVSFPSSKAVSGTEPLKFEEPISISTTNPNLDMCSTTATVKSEVTDAAFDILQSFSVSAGGEQAVGTDGQHIYTAFWQTPGKFGKYDLDGTFIETFTIAGVGGIRDFAYDGTYFYGGAAANTLYTLDLANKALIGTLATPAAVRHCDYDPVNDGFWIGNWTDLRLINRTGATLQTGPAVVSVYGSAYDGVTPGGPYLWLFAQVACGANVNNLLTIQQFDIAANNFTGVTHCADDLPGLVQGTAAAQTIAGGAMATDMLIPGKFVLMVNVQQTPNLIGVYELAVMDSWITLGDYNGIIAPGESQVVDVTLDATGLTDTTYYANINISHNGQVAGKATLTVPVEMTVASTVAPVAATLVSPVNNATLVPLQPVFTWINGAGTAFNRLVITTGNPPFTTTVYTSPWFLGETFDLASVGFTLDKKKTYNWQVRSRNAAGTVNSAQWKFTTIGAGTIQGVVTDAYNNQPLEGVLITASPAEYSTTTAANGTYSLTNVLEGTYDVTAEIEGYHSETLSTTVVHNGNSIVNFALDQVLDPPFGLQAQVQNIYDVHLTWIEPGTGFEPVWLKYTEVFDDAIGTGAAANFDVAMRFTPDMLAGFGGGSITKVKFGPWEASTVCTYTIKIWQGVQPPTLIYSQVVNTINPQVWNEVVLNNPVPFDINQELWIGFNANTTAGYPAGCDAGPQVEGFGNMIYWGGVWQTLTQLAPTLTYNWSLQAYVESAKGAVMLSPVADNPVISNVGEVPSLSPNRLETPQISSPNAGGESRALLGYNVYRDGSLLGIVTGNEYDDLDLTAGTYSYEVTAVYNQGESAPAGPVSVSILAPPTLLVADQEGDEVYLEWESNFVGKRGNDVKHLTKSVLGNTMPPKSDEPRKPIYTKPENSVRQGGDNIASATVIPAIPFAATGTTQGFTDDYNVACPYTATGGLDVVYAFTPAADIAINIDICASDYDTKLYVFETDQSNSIACNDDWCGSTTYMSYLENVQLTAGLTYYIVIDGYSAADFGTYYLDITEYEQVICDIECPVGSIPEGEPCAGDNYVDLINGGCNNDVPVFSNIANGDVICGFSSHYLFDDNGTILEYRDTDWYAFTLDTYASVNVTGQAEFPMLMFLIDLNAGCDGLVIAAQAQGAPCTDVSIQNFVLGPGDYALWVGPSVFTGYPCTTGDNTYFVEFSYTPVFMASFNVWKNGELLVNTTATSFYDVAIEPGNEYCYTVSEVVAQGVETGMSNELCADIPLYGEITVNPASLEETHSAAPEITTQTIVVTNDGDGVMDFNAAVVFEGKDSRASGLCIANLYSTGCFAFGDGIESWSFANVTMDIPCNDAGNWYNDFTNISHELAAGETYQLTVVAGYANTFVAVWIDFNDDLVLTPDELIADFECLDTNPKTVDVTIPAGAPGGNHVLRFRTNWLAVGTDPCATYSYGNAADFMATLGTPWISIAPTSGTLNPGESLPVEVTFNSAETGYGIFNADIVFTTNNPFMPQPEVIVPATLNVVDNTGTITGLVTDGLSKAPVSGVTITVDQLRDYTTVTGPDGTYTIAVNVGEYTVTATKAGYVSQTSQPVTVVGGQTVTQNFALELTAPVLLTADADFFGVEVTWAANPAIPPYGGRLAGVSLSNVADNTQTLAKEEMLHGPTMIVPQSTGSKAIGDDCVTPILIGALPYTDVNTTCGRGNTYSETCLGSYDGGEDIVYQLVLAEAKSLQIAMTTTATWTGMLITQECPIGNTCVSSTGTSSGNKTLLVDLAAGTYYIMLDTWPTPDCIGEFTLTVTEVVPLPGSTCATAVAAAEGLNTAPQAPYWYTFTPASDGLVTITSCLEGQAVDTRLWVYDACGGTQVAYNDDLNDLCDYYDYASAVTFPGTAGVAYKIFWDPYWTTDGFDFIIEVGDACVVECPAGAIAEAELCGEDLNGGCNANPVAFAPIAIGDVICGTAWADAGSRDTDWYELVIDSPKTLTWSVTAEFPALAFIIDGNNGCAGLTLIALGQAGVCGTAVATVTVVPGTYWLWVGAQVFEGYPCSSASDYVAELTAEDAFISYFNLYRDDVMVAEVYDTYYYDQDVTQGETYCYSVEQVFQPALISDLSNVLCATVPIQPVISVNPEEITELLEMGEISEQTLSVLNSSAGNLNFTAAVVFGKSGAPVSGSDITYPSASVNQDAVEIAEDAGSSSANGGYSVPLSNSKDLLFDNGPIVTGECATTLAPESMIGAPANSFGFNFNNTGGFTVAEDFTVPANMTWMIDSFEFFGYQTGSTTTSSFTGAFVRIWNGNPMLPGSAVVWGDLVTNVMTATDFTGIYRVSVTCDTQRPLMRIVASTSGLTLGEGTYYVEFGATGSLTSGPWVTIVSLPGSTPTGNAIQSNAGVWAMLESPAGTGNYVSLPFLVNGTTSTPWLAIDPKVGAVNGIGQFDIDVLFNATELENGVYTANIVINSNDPVTPQLYVPVTLYVGTPTQDILLPLGWSGWSAYVDPMVDASFADVIAPVVPNMIITQHFTQLFFPQYGINTMGAFTNNHGYVSKMSAESVLSLSGMMADPTIQLNAGWNLFPIIANCNLSAAEVFGAIPGFIIGYEVAGNGIYYPQGGVFNLTTLVPGKAYWVKVAGATSYTFPACAKGAESSYIAPLRHANTTPWNDVAYTGSSHIVVFNGDASVAFVQGDVIGAFTSNGICAGMTVVDGNAVSLALFADDITTSSNDGFAEAEHLTFRMYRQSNNTEYIVDVTYSTQAPNYDGLFASNGLSVISDFTMMATGVGSLDLNSLTIYPNPSQGIFNISVDNLSKDINWVVTDAKGQFIQDGKLAESQVVDMRNQPKGIYFIRFTGDNVLRVEKLVIR